MIKFKKPSLHAATQVKEPDPANPDPSPEPTFKIKDFPQNHLTYHLHKAIAGERGARPHNVIHASDLDPARNWCPREPALLTTYNFKRPSGFISTAQSTVFNFGHKAADIVIDSLPGNMVWGNWKCRACKHEHKHQYKPACCYNCKADRRALRYQEVFMRDPATGIVGSCDLMVDLLGNGMKTMIEIKSEGNASFKARTSAEFDHDWRTKLYLWIASKTPWLADKSINLHEARVIYITKEGHTDSPLIKKWGLSDWSKTPFKEYWVSRDDSFSQNQRAKVEAYRAWRTDFDANGDLSSHPLPKRVCKSKQDPRAKECSVCKQCFGG